MTTCPGCGRAWRPGFSSCASCGYTLSPGEAEAAGLPAPGPTAPGFTAPGSAVPGSTAPGFTPPGFTPPDPASTGPQPFVAPEPPAFLRLGDQGPMSGPISGPVSGPIPPPGALPPAPLAPPASPTPRSTAATVVVPLVVGLLLLAAVGAGAVFLARQPHHPNQQLALAAAAPSATGPATTPAGGSPGPAASPTAAPTATEPSTTETTPAGPTDEASAQAALQAEADRDQSAVEALVGSWIPQLSAKQPGLVVNGTTYDNQSIWQDFQSLRARYPSALLLWSGNYTSFKLNNFWVTVVPQAYGDPASANSWCDTNNFAPGDCFAKRLSHTDGPNGNSVTRN